MPVASPPAHVPPSARNLLCPAPLDIDSVHSGSAFVCRYPSGPSLYGTFTTDVMLTERGELVVGVKPDHGPASTVELSCLGITTRYDGGQPAAESYTRPTRIRKTSLLHPKNPARQGRIIGVPFLDELGHLAVYVQWDDLRVPPTVLQRLSSSLGLYVIGNFKIEVIW